MALLPASGQPRPHPVPATAVSTLWFALQGAARAGLLHLARPGHLVAVRWVTQVREDRPWALLCSPLRHSLGLGAAGPLPASSPQGPYCPLSHLPPSRCCRKPESGGECVHSKFRSTHLTDPEWSPLLTGQLPQSFLTSHKCLLFSLNLQRTFPSYLNDKVEVLRHERLNSFLSASLCHCRASYHLQSFLPQRRRRPLLPR